MLREHAIQIPIDPQDLGGAYSLGKACILGEKDGRGVARVIDYNSEEILWLKHRRVLFQTLKDGTMLKAIRLETDKDRKRYRVPLWIQDEEWPFCCDQPMFFVGQIDDDEICTEAPTNAEIWWHDIASFYVFTCSKCLGVQAVGQQF